MSDDCYDRGGPLCYEAFALKAHVDGVIAMVIQDPTKNAEQVEYALVDITRRLGDLGEKLDGLHPKSS